MSEILQQQIEYYRARASEYDEWWYSKGRYDKGEALNQQWEREGQNVRDALYKIPKQGHILELAPGTGIWTQELLKIGDKITAVDASAEMIAINKAKVQSNKVDYIQADLFRWQSEQQYDMIFFGFWLSHVPPEKYKDFLKGVSAMLKPGGQLFIVDSLRNKMATAKNQNMLERSHIHHRILNDGREFQIIKVFYQPDALQSDLASVNISSEVQTTAQFFYLRTWTKSSKLMTTRTLYMIRHGQYDMTVKTANGGSLTEIGKQQAEHAAKAVSRIPIDMLHASTMTRAIETANIIANQLSTEYKTHDVIREAIPTIPPRVANAILQMMEADSEFTHDTIHQDKKRADEAFAQFFAAPEADAQSTHEVLVCHGNIMRYLTCRALDINVDTWAKMDINHCGITIITVDEQARHRLITHNATGHLPTHLLTD